MAELAFNTRGEADAFSRRLWQAQQPVPQQGTDRVFVTTVNESGDPVLFMPDNYTVPVRDPDIDVTPFETVMSRQAAEQLLSRGTISVAQILGARR